MHMLQGSGTTFVCGLTGRAQHEVVNSPVQIPAAGVWCCMNVCVWHWMAQHISIKDLELFSHVMYGSV